MKRDLLKKIQCPKCHSELTVKVIKEKNSEIFEGALNCLKCNNHYKIDNYIPRFLEKYNYSESWGELWRNTGKTLRDSDTGETFYYDAIFGKWSEKNIDEKGYNPFGFEWPTSLHGQDVLEIGPGLGVCTEHLVNTSGEILSVDMSNAIDAIPEKILTKSNLNIIQADILSGVIKKEQFDKIWMFQVLQHTPKPSETLKYVYNLLKNEGEISFTSYYPTLHPYRFITKRMSFQSVYNMVKIFLPLKYYSQKFFMKIKLPFIAKICETILRPIDPRNIYFSSIEGKAKDYLHGKLYEKTKDKKQLFWLTVVNTFDAITPVYVNSATHEQIEKWTKEAKFTKIKIWGKSGVRVKALK